MEPAGDGVRPPQRVVGNDLSVAQPVGVSRAARSVVCACSSHSVQLNVEQNASRTQARATERSTFAINTPVVVDNGHCANRKVEVCVTTKRIRARDSDLQLHTSLGPAKLAGLVVQLVRAALVLLHSPAL